MRFALIALAALPLCACSILDTEAERGYSLGPGWTTGSAFTTASVRIVTQREHPLLHNQVVCTEPPPDAATALATAAALSGQGGNGTASGGIDFSGSSAEAVAELAGRSTALLGLRDGLYRACEAYASGIIGQDIYALVVSRYGQLMTTLLLGQDITGAAGAAAKAASINASISAPDTQQGTGSNKPSATPTPTGTPSATDPTTTKPSPSKASDSSAPGSIVRTTMLTSINGTDLKPKLLLVAETSPTKTPSTTPPSTTPPSTDTGTKGDATNSAVGVSTASELALTRMNEDYMNLDLNLAHLLVVACINNGDPTRNRTNVTRISLATPSGSPVPSSGTAASDSAAPQNMWLIPAQPTDAKQSSSTAQTDSTAQAITTTQGNTWLTPVCQSLTLDKITTLETNALAAITAIPKLQPVNPEVAATQPAAAQGSRQPASSAPKQAVDATVQAVQNALKMQDCTGCKELVADGIDGPKTRAAVTAYQSANAAKGLTPNGNPKDPATMKLLGV